MPTILSPRWVILIVITFFVAMALVYGQERGFIVSGPMTATDQEWQEGYFHVGKEFMVITKPGSPIHDDLKAMLGHDVDVVVHADK